MSVAGVLGFLMPRCPRCALGSLEHLFLRETSQTIEANLFILVRVNHMPKVTLQVKGKAGTINICFDLNTRDLLSLLKNTS